MINLVAEAIRLTFWTVILEVAYKIDQMQLIIARIWGRMEGKLRGKGTEMRKYRKKQEIVEAWELEEEVGKIHKADFMVMEPDGTQYRVERGVFLDTYEVIEDIEGQVEHVDIGITGRTLAWAGAFSALLDKLVGHPRAALREKAKELKQTDGEGWVAGELLESICHYADAVDAQIGRVQVMGPPLSWEEVDVRDEYVQKVAALDCLLAKLEGYDRQAILAKAQAFGDPVGLGARPSPEASLIAKIVSDLCTISFLLEKGGSGSLDGGRTWFRFPGPEEHRTIRCDCAACEEDEAKQVGPCAPQGDDGSRVTRSP